ncbi:MAG: DNA polymerase III subunit gamma/tau [Flavobacteriales bacterium]|nr:DNA polymerase III subunit gamma/tau [Flavobacteriales bacterium]
MEPFVVSARKYRPKTFDEVVGQGHIAATLENAIQQNQIAQAMLFCGPRGVGKTTCARILAREINKKSMPDAAEDEDFAFNIHELDAASNNSVEDIRALIDQVRFAPQIGKYKVYIIDEVHMLSTAAFNAFLKTLEEPPAHAIFILATTEKHKILPTILSRCQIFDFRLITVEDIRKHLEKIAADQGVTADAESLHMIATKAEGALRDALSIYDRVVSFCGKNLTSDKVAETLNVLDYQTYFSLTQSILDADIPALMLKVNTILQNGFDAQYMLTGLASHLRDLMVSRDERTLPLLTVPDDIKERYRTQAQSIDYASTVDALTILSDVQSEYRTSKNQRLLTEICLMRLASLGMDPSKKKVLTT